ncbi:hypothetical protein AGMMS49938_10120 [Fibrobacterales bacterium]|nr:hypothetical protein AGMMS49938_10120 [Fibrobacterales bacterium]
MKKLFLVPAFAASVFFACGSQDGSPAEITNNITPPINISPFDTLSVKFDSKITSIDSVSLPTLTKLPNSELRFVGNYDSTLSGLKYFEQNTTDSIVFAGVKNDDDYTTKRAVFYYNTIRILDDIKTQSNNSYETAANIDFGGKITSVFAGVLEHKIGGNAFNGEDFYKLELTGRDILILTFESSDSLNVELKGPKGDTTFTVTKKNPILIYRDAINHLGDTDTPTTPLQFYIRISDYGSVNSLPNPYTVTLLIEKK